MEDDPDLDYSPGFAFDGADASALAGMAQNLLTMADNLPEEDPKFDQMLEVIMEKQKQENNKIILFKISNYFREFSTEYKKVNHIDGRFPNDWYEYIEYGTPMKSLSRSNNVDLKESKLNTLNLTDILI